nr:MAG TPA: hypothetical protein [Caudoviricetes sp.]
MFRFHLAFPILQLYNIKKSPHTQTLPNETA